jgi:hypothetical protein
MTRCIDTLSAACFALVAFVVAVALTAKVLCSDFARTVKEIWQ